MTGPGIEDVSMTDAATETRVNFDPLNVTNDGVYTCTAVATSSSAFISESSSTVGTETLSVDGMLFLYLSSCELINGLSYSSPCS